MQRIFIGFVAFCAALGAALGVFLYISLLPHFGIISWFAAAVVIVSLSGVMMLIAVFVYSQAGVMLARRRHERLHAGVIAIGEIVAVPNGDGTYTHLSAQHVAAGVPRLLPAPRDEEAQPYMDDATVIELYQQGLTLQSIVAATHNSRTYYQVQKVIAEAKSKGLIG